MDGKVLGEECLHAMVDERVEVGAEGLGHTGRAYDVLEDQIPADDEGHELADGHVRVDVGRACLGHARSELGVAEAGHD